MADEPDNLVLELLREIRGDIARLDGKIDDVGAELRSEIRAPLHALLSRVQDLIEAFPPEEAERLRSQVSRDWDFGGGPSGP